MKLGTMNRNYFHPFDNLQNSVYHNFFSARGILYFLIYISFIVINVLTPLNGDDYNYMFNYADGTPISSLSDVIESQYIHYQTVNGRAIPHVFEQIFAGLTGKWLFNILNALFSLVLIILTNHLIIHTIPRLKDYEGVLINITFIATFFLFSYPGQSMFWMAGGLNYLWPTVLALLVWHLFTSHGKYNLFAVAVFSLFSAWFQEAISIPLAVSLWIYIIISKEYRSKSNLIMAIAYTFGTLLIIFSGGTMGRLASNELHHDGGIVFLVVSKLLETLSCLRNLYVFWISFVLILINAIVVRTKFLKKYVNLLVLWVVNTGFFFALGFPHERITLFLSVISYVIVISLLSPILLEFLNKKKNVFLLFVGFLSIFSVVYVFNVCRKHSSWNNCMMEEIEKNADEHVVLKKDVFKGYSRLVFPEKLSSQALNSHNRSIAKYFGKSSVQFLKPQLYDSIQKLNLVYGKQTFDDFIPLQNTNFYIQKSHGLYYLQLPQQYFWDDIEIVAHHTPDNRNLNGRQLFIRSILNTLDRGESSLDHIVIWGNNKCCYCIIPSIPQKEDTLQFWRSRDSSFICSFKRNK